MTTRRGSRRSFRSRGPKPKLSWDQTSFVHILALAGGSLVTDITNLHISAAGGAGIPTGTCIRMVGNLTVFQRAIGVEEQNYNIGVSVMTADALFAGATPDPRDDVLQDWYYWRGWEGMVSDDQNHEASFDIRSSRRLREGFRLAWVTQNSSTEVDAEMRVHLRTLWRMP